MYSKRYNLEIYVSLSEVELTKILSIASVLEENNQNKKS